MGKCIIYPVFQKYYNALKQLDDLSIDSDLFEGISKVDAFFAEFRNITFVMQKSFNTPELKKYYDEKRNLYFSGDNLRWFVSQRNAVTKEESFKLEKGIRVDVYHSGGGITITDGRMTINNEKKLEEVFEDLKIVLGGLEKYTDVFFSVILSFRENGQELDIYEILKKGIIVMNEFIANVIKDYPCDCNSCQELKKRTNELLTRVICKDISFIWDCSLENGEIIFGDIAETYMGLKDGTSLASQEIRAPLKGSFYDPEGGCGITTFQKFASSHLVIYQMQKNEIMPVFMIVYADDTYSFLPFMATSKATFYRMVSRIAKIVREREIKSVYYAGEFYAYPLEKIEEIHKPYKERIQTSNEVIFSCTMMSKQFSQMLNIDFEVSKISNIEYVRNCILNPQTTGNNLYINWLSPLWDSLIKN